MCTPEAPLDSTQMREHLQAANDELDQLLKRFVEELGDDDDTGADSW